MIPWWSRHREYEKNSHQWSHGDRNYTWRLWQEGWCGRQFLNSVIDTHGVTFRG